MATTSYINTKLIKTSVSYTDISTVAAHALPVIIPDNAVVTKVWYDVVTTFTSATDSATIALHLQSAGDIVAAIAISDATNPWDAGVHSTKIPYGANSTYTATALTTVAPSSADFAIQTINATSPEGFETADEGNTAMGVLKDLQAAQRKLEQLGVPGMLKMTANRTLTATTAVDVLTAGALNIYVEYVDSE